MSPHLLHEPRSVAAVCAEMLCRAVLHRRDAAASDAEWRRLRCIELARAYERRVTLLAQGYLPGLER